MSLVDPAGPSPLPGADPIAALDGAVAQHLRAILDAAWACPPGGDRRWDALLAYYGVAPDAPVDRVNTSRELGMERGALPSELGRVLHGLGRWAHGQLVAIASAPGVAADPRLAGLGARIVGLAAQELARYEGAVVRRRAPSVGSIFANASSTAAETPWANVKVEPANVLVCAGCGAPQERLMTFRCRYCQAPF